MRNWRLERTPIHTRVTYPQLYKTGVYELMNKWSLKKEGRGRGREGGRRELVYSSFVPISTIGQSFPKLVPVLIPNADPVT